MSDQIQDAVRLAISCEVVVLVVDHLIAVAPAGPSIATQIEDLTRLREQGLISAEEFNAKRTGLLARL